MRKIRKFSGRQYRLEQEQIMPSDALMEKVTAQIKKQKLTEQTYGSSAAEATTTSAGGAAGTTMAISTQAVVLITAACLMAAVGIAYLFMTGGSNDNDIPPYSTEPTLPIFEREEAETEETELEETDQETDQEEEIDQAVDDGAHIGSEVTNVERDNDHTFGNDNIETDTDTEADTDAREDESESEQDSDNGVIWTPSTPDENSDFWVIIQRAGDDD